MLREPAFEALNLDNSKDAVLHWHTLSCELITPMYGGGTVSTKVDTKMPIRASAIRGQLRFWWRLLAKHKWELKDIPQKEKEIWGGIDSGGGIAGNVLLRVNNLSRRITENYLVRYDDDSLKSLKYVLFPAYNETDETKKPHRLLNQGLTFDLQFAFCEKIVHQNEIKNQVDELKNIIDNAKKSVKKRFIKEASNALSRLPKDKHYLRETIWNSQLDDYLEIQTAWARFGDDNSYHDAAQKAGQTLASRKATRDFSPTRTILEKDFITSLVQLDDARKTTDKNHNVIKQPYQDLFMLPKSSLDGMRETVLKESGLQKTLYKENYHCPNLSSLIRLG